MKRIIFAFIWIYMIKISPNVTKGDDECDPKLCKGDKNMECVSTNDSYTVCMCRRGFRLQAENNTCEDVDECTLGQCGSGMICRNSFGSFACVCEVGYHHVGDKKKCEDMDECKDGPCQTTTSLCKNLPGSYLCLCRKGFRMVSNFCQDVDECSVSACDLKSSRCENTVGSYRCTCKEGFVMHRGTNESCILKNDLFKINDSSRTSKLHQMMMFMTNKKTILVINIVLMSIFFCFGFVFRKEKGTYEVMKERREEMKNRQRRDAEERNFLYYSI